MCQPFRLVNVRKQELQKSPLSFEAIRMGRSDNTDSPEVIFLAALRPFPLPGISTITAALVCIEDDTN